jgi:hypothetical protein
MDLILERAYLDNCTIGKIYRKGVFVCYSLERPWLSNEKNVSCIPEGDYFLRRHDSPRFGDCFYLERISLGVSLNQESYRTHILIHPANHVDQLLGCIAPGLWLHPSKWGVSDSRNALKKLIKIFETETIDTILIK